MGAICGFIAGPETALPERRSALEAMAGALKHRGTGDDILYHDERAALCRLQKEAGSGLKERTLTNEKGRYRIAFDGAIYNHLQLRRELQNRGHRFRTRNEFEAVLHLYEEIGGRCPEKLRGPFAFALWDSEEGVLYLARDRFGIKPLYYTRAADGAFVFASEAKALLKYPAVTAAVNEAALPHYLTFQYFPGTESAFKGIYRLPPAHHLTRRGGVNKIRRYWEIRFHPAQKPPRYFIDKAGQLLQESVRLHCEGGEIPGAFLSSGVDSSFLAALLGRRGALHSFSVDCAGGNYNELAPAKATAHLLGAAHHETEIGPREFWRVLPRAFWHLDEPIADPAAIALYFAAALAAGEVKAVLSGEGADEVFGGYEIYREPAAVAPLQWLPGPFREKLLQISDRLPQGMKGKSYLRRAATPLEKRYYGNAFIFSEPEKRALLKSGLFPAGQPSPWEITAPYYRKSADYDATTRMQHLDFHTWLPGDILAKADRISSAHSLEVRLPYLDHLLVEFAATIPPSLKMAHGMTKYILRAAASRYLPETVCRRPKLGFPVPLAAWIREHYQKSLAELWQSDAARLYFNPAALEQMLREHCRGESDNARKLWTVATFLLWHDLYIG